MTTLGSWLKDQGFSVDDNDVPYGRDSEWHGVDFLMVHHTVSDCDGSESSIANYCRTATDYPPICQIVLGHSGKVWMTSKERSGQKDPGRASHAGSGSGYGVPKDSMNAYALGIECQCIGDHKLATHETQYATLIRLLAALSRRYSVPVANIIGHKEWSSTGKVDPRDSMNDIRADVTNELEDEVADVLDYDYLNKPGGTFTVTNSYKTLDQSNWNPPRAGWENTLVYLNITPKFKSGKNHGAIRVRLMRENGDAHGYDTIPIDADDLDEDGVILKQYFTWELGEKGGETEVQMKCVGGLESASIGTRYTSKAVIVG
jgi:N-acetylmuramoyl-L-alanine amidase